MKVYLIHKQFLADLFDGGPEDEFDYDEIVKVYISKENAEKYISENEKILTRCDHRYSDEAKGYVDEYEEYDSLYVEEIETDD